MMHNKFLQDVSALTFAMKEMGSLFEEESADLLVLHTVKNVNNAIKLGQ